jgi:predicted enzyme related to lactoylglutathione lyase
MRSSKHGKICYLEIPTDDLERSVAFYSSVFGWSIRSDNAGNAAFDDPTGGVSGMWVPGKTPDPNPGIIISIMVDDAAETQRAIETNGGTIVAPLGSMPPELIAHFKDPSGNKLGIYQEPNQ